MPVDDTQHRRDQVNGENIVGVGEETNTGDDYSAYMVPTKGRLVYLGESKPSSFLQTNENLASGNRMDTLDSKYIRIGNMRIVVVEVVEGSIATSSLVGHLEISAVPWWRDGKATDDMRR